MLYVCSLHFDSEAYFSIPTRKLLKPDAVPQHKPAQSLTEEFSEEESPVKEVGSLCFQKAFLDEDSGLGLEDSLSNESDSPHFEAYSQEYLNASLAQNESRPLTQDILKAKPGTKI